MGMNLHSACHIHRVTIMHMRGGESQSIHPFYQDHLKCMKGNPDSVQTLSDYYQDADALFSEYKSVFGRYFPASDITAKKSLGGDTPTPVKSKPKED